ncbi:J domain-containing protein [candidate division KSB1 bacterium]|nr:J domain-containing protein [candidate division KSB1 bacterium]
MNDYYQILGVSEKADSAEIKSAYRRLAKNHHPDANKGDPKAEERFKQISEAYSVLSNSKRRAEYDRLRQMGAFAGGKGGGFDKRSQYGKRWSRGANADSASFDIGSIFEQFFGGSRSNDFHSMQLDGADRLADLTVPFLTAARGGKQRVTLNFHSVCGQCSGTGRDQQSGGPCRSCAGTGKKEEKRTIEIIVPPASDDGKRIRLKGLGEPGLSGGQPGDLIVVLHVEKHPRFERKGLDLTVEESIDMVKAALGTRIRIESLDGKPVELVVPAGTQPSKVFRLKGLGIRADGKSGDLYVRLRVVIPQTLTAEAARALKTFAQKAGLSNG